MLNLYILQKTHVKQEDIITMAKKNTKKAETKQPAQAVEMCPCGSGKPAIECCKKPM